MSPNKNKKLTQYIPGRTNASPLFIVGIFVIGVLAVTGVFRSAGSNLLGKGGRDDIVASSQSGSNVSNSEACNKAGINLAGPFGHANTDNLVRARNLGMGWMLAIATEPSEAGFVAERIKAASSLGINTILRICYHDNCGFKQVGTYVQFLKDVAAQSGGVTFYAIAGPNEPLNENWLPNTESIPVPIPSNDSQYDTVGRELAKYMNSVISGVRGDSSMSNVKLLSPIFNIGRFDFYDKLLGNMKKYSPNFDGLDGIAGNTYVTNDGQLIKPEMEELKAEFPGKELYITETGTFTRNFDQLIGEVKSAFIDDPQVKAYLFFNAFGTNADSTFQNFVLSNEQIAYIIEGATGENCTQYIPDPNIEPAEGVGYTDSLCPFDGDLPKDLESCQTLASNTDPDYPAKGSCGAGATVCAKLKIYKCDGSGASAATCAAAGRSADGRWYGGFETTSHVEKIPTLRYLQAVTGSYQQDDLPDDGVDARQIQSIPPCFLRNVTNFFPEINWSNKFDGRVGLTSGSNKNGKAFGVFPLLGTAAGCMVYNQNDFYGNFNQIAGGFREDGKTGPFTPGGGSSAKVQGILDPLFDLIASVFGFDLKALFNIATPSQEQALSSALCETGGSNVTSPMTPAVTSLNDKDTIDLTKDQSGRAYESVIDSEEIIMTDTDLCDRQLTGDRKISGASCNVGGWTFTTSDTIEITGPSGNVIETIKYQEEKAKNGGVVDSATGNPVLNYKYDHVSEISLDGMKRALAGAYLDEAIFFHSLGTRPGQYATETGGYRVIHNKNVGIQVPMRLRVYDMMDHQFPEGGGGKNNQENSEQCTGDIDFYSGEFGLAEGDKVKGHDIYIVPWMGQIPRMYGRISAIGTDYKIDDTGNIVSLSGKVTSSGEQRILHCYSPEYRDGDDCIVEWESSKHDPLMDWLISEGVLSEAEIKGTFGYNLPKLEPGQKCVEVADPENTVLNKTTVKKIMLFGDSITDGGDSGGYRKLLETKLRAAGLKFDFVGKRESGPEDNDHEGTPGATPKDILDSVDAAVSANNPNIILLYAGVNGVCDLDPETNSDYIKQAVEKALNHSGVERIFVAKIARADVYVDPGGENFKCDEIQRIEQFNSKVQSKLSGMGKITVVDMQDLLTLGDGDYQSEDITGVPYNNSLQTIAEKGYNRIVHIHPNQSGYSKIADKWFTYLSTHATKTVCSSDNNQCSTGSAASPTSTYEDLMKKVASFLNSQPGGSRITWTAMWGILSQESLRRCTPDYKNWTATLQSAKATPLSLAGNQVADYTDKCSGDPNQLGLYGSPHDTVMGVSQIKAGTFNSIADNYWRNSAAREQHGVTTGELLKRCTQYIGVDTSKGQESSNDAPEPIEERFRSNFSRKRVGDSLCAMGIMLSEIAAAEKGNGNYVPEAEWDDSVIYEASHDYYGSDVDDSVCSDNYCANVTYYANFARDYYAGGTAVQTDAAQVSCEYNSDDGNVNVYSGSCNEIFEAVKGESPYADVEAGRNATLRNAQPDCNDDGKIESESCVCAVAGNISCGPQLTSWCETCPIKANLLLRHELNHVIAGVDFFSNDGNVSEFAADATSLNGGWYKFKYKGGGQNWEYATNIKSWIMQNYMVPNGVSERTFTDYLNGRFTARDTLDRVFAEDLGINKLMATLVTDRTISGSPPPAAASCTAQVPVTAGDYGIEKNSCGVFSIDAIIQSRLSDKEKELYKKLKSSLERALTSCDDSSFPGSSFARHIKFCPKLELNSCSASVKESGWTIADRDGQFEVVIVSEKFIDKSSPYYSLVGNMPLYAAMTSEERTFYSDGKKITYPNTLIINFDYIRDSGIGVSPYFFERLWLHEFAHIEQAWGVNTSSSGNSVLSDLHVDTNSKHTLTGRFFEACADEDMIVSSKYAGKARIAVLRNAGISSQLIEQACKGDLISLNSLKNEASKHNLSFDQIFSPY